ncbi:fibroblast growth factor receptor substrate 2-like [Branchiostoma floridae x Branchiostoma japonicum]
MGCVYGKVKDEDFEDSDPRRFHVRNVDDDGNELEAGVLEVTAGDLILYLKNRDPIRWPLKCLRRYGYDSNLFSFESGRRCHTGPGIYAFKCRRAEDLFNIVQDTIQGGALGDGVIMRLNSIDEDTPDVRSRTPLPSSTSSIGIPPRSPRRSHDHEYINGNIDGAAGESHTYINTTELDNADLTPTQVEFKLGKTPAQLRAERERRKAIEGEVNYADINLPNASEESDTSGTLVSPNNGNVTAVMPHPPEVGYADLDIESLEKGKNLEQNDNLPSPNLNSLLLPVGLNPHYQNVNIINENATRSRKNSCHRHNSIGDEQSAMNGSMRQIHNYENLPTNGSDGEQSGIPKLNKRHVVNKLHYIQLDLDQNNENNNPVSPSPNTPSTPRTPCTPLPETPNLKKPEFAYATIDFDKTQALSFSQNPQPEDDGVRKTRHNSTTVF